MHHLNFSTARRLGHLLASACRHPGAWLGLVAVVLAHRLQLLIRHGAEAIRLSVDHPGFVTMQLMPVESLLEHPLLSLWFLQGMPPIPNAMVAPWLRIVSSPEHLVIPLWVTNILLTAAVSALLLLVGRRWIDPAFAFVLALLWGLGPDAVLLETIVLSQAFYENVTLLWLLLATWAFQRLQDTAKMRHGCLLGSCLALAALTRSSYSFVIVPAATVLLLLLFLRGNRRLVRPVAVAVLAALLVQGAWSLKNWYVFGHFGWATSTWGGASLTSSIRALGEGEALERALEEDIRHRPERHAPWMEEYLEAHGVDPWASDWIAFGFCPERYRKMDDHVLESLGERDRHENTSCQRLVSEELGKASWRYLARHPGFLFRKLKWGYSLYWHPIRQHRYLAVYGLEHVVERPFRPWRSVALLFAGALPETKYLQSGTLEAETASPDTLAREPVRLFTLDLPVTAWWIVEIVTLHLLLPFVLLAIAWRAWRSRTLAPRDALTLFVTALFAYAAFVHNVAEFGENMRFRWNVEPLLWLLTADVLERSLGKARTVLGRSGT